MFRRLDRVRCTKHRRRVRSRRPRKRAHLQEPCVPRPDVQCRDSRFFSVRARKFRAEDRRVPCVQGNAVRCILRARRRQAHVLLGLVRGYRLRDRLVRELVLAHGGTVEVSSTEAEGTTFTLTLPRLFPASDEASGA